MSNVVTARQYFNANVGKVGMYDMLIEFAKLHCKAQRREIISELRKEESSNSYIESMINNSYQLDNIK